MAITQLLNNVDSPYREDVVVEHIRTKRNEQAHRVDFSHIKYWFPYYRSALSPCLSIHGHFRSPCASEIFVIAHTIQ